MQRIREYHKKNGFRKLILKLVSLIGIIIKKEFIFFEIKLQNTSPLRQNTSNLGLDFVCVKQKEFDHYEFPSDDKFLTKNKAFKRITKNNYELLTLTSENKIVSYIFNVSNKARLPGGLIASIPDNVAYSSAMYTAPQFRGKGLGSTIMLLQLKFLQEQGYHKAFSAVKPNRTASLKIFKKGGYKEYQTVTYSKFLFLKYYCVKDYDTEKMENFWYIKGIDQKLWNHFSKIRDN